jgi:signal transduction histidine kinase
MFRHEGRHSLLDNWITDMRKRHAEAHRSHQELKQLHFQVELKQAEIHRYLRYNRYSRWIPVILNLILWYAVYHYAGLRAMSIALACVFSFFIISGFVFQNRLTSRVFLPINDLNQGVEQIARGNYAVRVEKHVDNELGGLIDSFNDMAQKLQEGERIKAEYETNRRALIANISHDLKTPITSVQGYIEAIREQSELPPETLNRYLKIIYNNTAYINKLIDDLFLFSKLDLQKLDFHFEELPVRPFVHDIMEEFRLELELEERSILFAYADQLEQDCLVKIDRKRLHQVFRNLISNAVKYSANEDSRIEVTLTGDGAWVSVAVSDNGPGIAPEQLPYIFDRFYRTDRERKKDLSSTGLGLAIARELVEAHGGQITAANREPGACFTVRLPVLKQAPGKDSDEENSDH